MPPGARSLINLRSVAFTHAFVREAENIAFHALQFEECIFRWHGSHDRSNF
jgi:hypothetical protein